MKKIRRLAFAVAVLMLAEAASAAQDVFAAAKAGDVEKVRALLASDAGLAAAKDSAGNTPLHLAASGGSAPIVALLLARGAAVDALNAAGLTPLLEAIQAGRLEAAQALLAGGADVRRTGAMGRGPLHFAALSDFAAAIPALKAKGADLEMKDLQGLTPLACALLWSPGTGVVRALLDAGADLNAKNARGRSMLDMAIGGYRHAAANIEILLDRGVACPPDRALNMLQVAAADGAEPLFRRLTDKYGQALFADPRANRETMTKAVLGGSTGIVQALLAQGAAVDAAPDADGLTLLHRVAEIPAAAGLIGLLAKNGLDIDARTPDGRSAYNLAEAAGNGEARRALEALGAKRDPQKFPLLSGPYLGQTPPTGDPVPFARGLIIRNHGVVTMSPDGLEMYWSSSVWPGARVPRSRVFMTVLRDGRWTTPAIAPFSGTDASTWADDSPFVAPDNRKLFFLSTRPQASGAANRPGVWFVERTNDGGWSSPRPLGPGINPAWEFSVARTGALYFADAATTDILVSRPADGVYGAPVPLGAPINTREAEVCPFIAPDESYLIFSRASGPEAGYHISFRLKDGTWSPPAALKHMRMAQPTSFVSPDGRFIFFGYEYGFWAPAAFIEAMRPKEES